MISGTHITTVTFSDGVQKYLRKSGHSQKELASELSLHPKVLSRKLHESRNAHLTHLEVQRIITTLAGWHAITTQDEVLHLLEQAQLDPGIIDSEAWQTSPLRELTKSEAQPVPAGDLSVSTVPYQHNLPAPITRLIGREWAVARLRQLLGLDNVRLVTMVGSGGCGKTRLALQIARELVGTFEQGVWFVSLAGVNDPDMVPMSIIQALGIKPTPGLSLPQSLTAYLRNKHLLLVLDNFEQVSEATFIVDELLAAAPGLKVLVTSRVVLHLYGEYEFKVPPLDMPKPGAVLEKAELSHYEAIQLFVERAQAIAADFALNNENGAIIAQICARVDGLPLALELAAAQVKVLPPAQLLERLSQARLSVLKSGARNVPSRQKTLRNTIMWSYDLLSPFEQAWFRRLGVFTGGWTLEAAETMMQTMAGGLTQKSAAEQEEQEEQENRYISDSLLEILEQLMDNNLVVQQPVTDGQVRFTMLETLREYALEQLIAQKELEQIRDWHACYYLRVAEAAEVGLRGSQQLAWLKRLADDRDNFQAALDWSLQRARAGMVIQAASFCKHEADAERVEVAGSRTLSSKPLPDTGLLAVELSLRLAAAFRHYWEWQGYLTEGRRWLSAALAVPLQDRTCEKEKTVLAARAKALSELSRLVCLENDQARAAELADEGIALWQQLDDASGLATAMIHRAWPALATSDYKTARHVCLEGLQRLSSQDDPWLRAQLLFYLAAAYGFTGEFEKTSTYYTQSRELFEQIGDKSSVIDVLKDQGAMLILESKYTESIACLLESIQLSYEIGYKQFIATGLCWLSFAVGLREEPDSATASLYAAQLKGATAVLMEAIGLTPWAETHPLTQLALLQLRSRVDEQSWEAAWAAGRKLSTEQAIELARLLGEGTPTK